MASPSTPSSNAEPMTDQRSRPRQKRNLVALGAGNAIEWFDWNAYAVFSTVLALNFFPRASGGTALLQTLLVFAIGFFFRPLGGLLIAAVSDRRGRRAGMIVTVTLMAGGSLVIGLTPSYETIGIAAPLLLVLARAAQGLSAGGEKPAMATALAEFAPVGKRGIYGSVGYISDTIGTLTALGASLLLRSVLTESQLNSWGWRLVFIFGALAGVVAYILRRNLKETDAYQKVSDKATRTSLWAGLRQHPKASLQIVGLTMGGTVWFLMFAIYLPTFVKAANPAIASQVDVASILSLIIFCVTLPLFGYTSDRFGHRRWTIIFCGLATITAVPLYSALTDSALSLFVVQTTGLLIFAFYGAVSPCLMAQLFPTEVRAVGLGFPYAICLAVFGGSAPYLLEWLSGMGQRNLFAWYLSALCLVALITSLTLTERSKVRMDEI